MKHTDIIKTLNLEQKCALLSGETVFTTRDFSEKGIPAITLSDGPNGVRKQAGRGGPSGPEPQCAGHLLPHQLPRWPTAGTPPWARPIGEAMGEEAAAQEVAVLLGPGLNIKRSPLCGRNFEYFSEDPYLAGKMAAGYVRGIQNQRHRRLPQALCRQQPGAAPDGQSDSDAGRAHPAGDVSDRL